VGLLPSNGRTVNRFLKNRLDLEFKKGGASTFKRAAREQVFKEESANEDELMFPKGSEDLNWDMPEDEEDSREDSRWGPHGTQAVGHPK